MPNRPAPRKPAARPPSRPRPLKRPPAGEGEKPGRLKVEPGWPGEVIERSIGRAAFGVVAVGGGAENVRLPRLPALKRGAASAVTAKASVSATAASASAERRRNADMFPSKMPENKPGSFSELNMVWFCAPRKSP